MRRLSIFLVALIVVAACAPKDNPFFVQISDPQLGFINLSEDYSPEADLFGRAIAQVNELKPDFVVLSGDFIQWRSDTVALAAFDSLRTLFAPDISVYYVPGNHDVGNDALAWEVEAFVKRYGHDRFVHKAGDYTVVGYNSSVVKAQTAAEPAEYAWLEEQLSHADSGKPLIVVAHIPMYINTPDEAETYENLPPQMREKYIALFEKYGVDTYLAGHLHKCARREYKGIDFVIASALGRQLGEDKNGYTIVTFEDGKPVAEYVAVDSEIENVYVVK